MSFISFIINIFYFFHIQLACRTERESRALEVCQLMPSYHTVQLAIKYAGKLHRMQLADKLGEVASAKMEEEMERAAKAHQMEEEDDLQMYVQIESIFAPGICKTERNE